MLISTIKTADRITLEDEYEFDAYISVKGKERLSDYEINLEFFNLDLDKYKQLVLLWKEPKALKIKSRFIDERGFRISHIIGVKISTNSQLAMNWECLSDDPDMKLELD